MKNKPEEIWSQYQKLTNYLQRYNVYETVKNNENFYDGRQWEGIKADNMPKPVINILQRVVKYFIATIGTNDVAVSITPFTVLEDDIRRVSPITQEIDNIIETAKIKEASKVVIRNAAVDGSSYMMQTFNPDYETGQPCKGRIENKIIDNTNMYFGNPYSNDIQTQPYIIVAFRQYLKQVKQEAKLNGVSKDDIEMICADNDGNQANQDDATDLCTVLVKYYKDKRVIKTKRVEMDLDGNPNEIEEEKTIETVWATKCTKNVTLIKPMDLGYKRYPISCFGWDLIKNSYLYNSPITSVIPNQVFINKCYALSMQYAQQSAMPKVVYDKSKVDIDKFLNSTNPQAVAGIDMMGKFLDFIKVPDFSNKIIDLVNAVETQTKECMGVNDASLGNVKPENTSAIIALQESSNVPLEIQKQQFYDFWEDTIRNILDIMSVCYGTRQVMEDKRLFDVDFSILNDINYNLRVDVGNGAQFSEISQISTLDKLFKAGLVDAPTYIESIPQKYIMNKGKILTNLMNNQVPATQPQVAPNIDATPNQIKAAQLRVDRNRAVR